MGVTRWLRAPVLGSWSNCSAGCADDRFGIALLSQRRLLLGEFGDAVEAERDDTQLFFLFRIGDDFVERANLLRMLTPESDIA